MGMYVATSKEIAKAKKFSLHGWIIQFRIPAGCSNAGDISRLSSYFDEAEVLLPPYTAVHVTEISATERRIKAIVLDNLLVPETVPTMLA